jgi:hypothetical protein
VAIAQDEMRENGKHGFARGTLDTPEGEATKPKSGIMGVACETAAAMTRGIVTKLEADGEEESQNEFNERFAITQQLQVGRFIVKIDDNGAVLAGRFGALSHVSPSVEMAVGADETSCG